MISVIGKEYLLWEHRVSHFHQTSTSGLVKDHRELGVRGLVHSMYIEVKNIEMLRSS